MPFLHYCILFLPPPPLPPLRPNLLQAIVKLFELPEDDSVPDDEHFIEIEDTPGNVVTVVEITANNKEANYMNTLHLHTNRVYIYFANNM